MARSAYAEGARQYRERIREITRQHFGKPLTDRNLSVEVWHFYTSGHAVDLDNLLKPVLDGLKQGAYEDDSQVTRVVAERFNISGPYILENPRPEWIDLLPPITRPTDFVAVTIRGYRE